jgi:hypothetical protein
MAAVVARLFRATGLWVLPVALLLTLILQNSFNLYLRIRKAYGETIGALAHAAELDRPGDSGHARRVADLSVSVGRAMGLSSSELSRIGFAGLLHEIGRIGDHGRDQAQTHKRRGADIASRVPFLEGVAPLIHCPDEAGQPVGGRIIEVCSKYDRLRQGVGAQTALHAVVAEYEADDPRVVEALEHVVTYQRSTSGAR